MAEFIIFFVWLAVHAVILIATRLTLGRNPNYEYGKLNGEALWMNALWYAVPFSWLIDRRAPSHWLFVLGLLVYVLSSALLAWAKLSNPHFKPEIELPPVVVRSGAYRYLNHPGYVAMVGMGLGSLWMLGHVIGYFPLFLYSFLLLIRAQEEDRLLNR